MLRWEKPEQFVPIIECSRTRSWTMNKILFICSANKQRSATAEDYFSAKYPNLHFDSAGTNHKLCRKEGTQALEEAHLVWADRIIVMEKKHADIIQKFATGNYQHKIHVANIRDVFKYYQKELLDELEQKIDPLLRSDAQ